MFSLLFRQWLVFFQNDEMRILEWITDKKTLLIPGKIEKVNSDMLDKLISTETDILVFLYRENILSDQDLIDQVCIVDCWKLSAARAFSRVGPTKDWASKSFYSQQFFFFSLPDSSSSRRFLGKSKNNTVSKLRLHYYNIKWVFRLECLFFIVKLGFTL